MPNNFLRTTFRKMLKERMFTVLNLVGLSTGLAASMLIYFWVQQETEFDKFHANGSRLYQVMAHISLPDGIHTQQSTPALLASSLKQEMPEVTYAVPFQQDYEQGDITAGNTRIRAKRFYAGKDFFRAFSFRLLAGNWEQILTDKSGVLLSEGMAIKLFHRIDHVIGERLQWSDDKDPFYVSGIFANPPSNSSLQFETLFSYDLYYEKHKQDMQYWQNCNPSTYLVLNPQADLHTLSGKLEHYLQTKDKGSPLTLTLRKFNEQHLYGNYENGKQAGGRIQYVRIFSLIAAFILLIACINFTNLSTAGAAMRLKDAGIKKVLGAKRTTLVFHFILETQLMAWIALLFAMLFVFLLLPQFNRISGSQVSLNFTPSFLFSLISIGTITGLVAGLYPALYISGFNPLVVLKGKFRTIRTELWIRKGLVVFQYVLCMIFLVSVFVMHRQMELVQHIHLGYQKENILRFKNEKRINDRLQPFMNGIKNIPGVVQVSDMSGDMSGDLSGNTEKLNWEGKDPRMKVILNALDVDYGMIELLGIRMEEGRSFSRSYGSDTLAMILNETAVQTMQLKNPIGKTVTVWGGTYHIIGVVKDFHYESIYKKVQPCFIRCIPGGSNIYVKVSGENVQRTVSSIGKMYTEFNSGLPFEFSFMDQDYQAMYVSEQVASLLFIWFAGLAVIIACLGLFGLAAFSAKRRQKEISIRKIVGASVMNLSFLLSREFFNLLLIALSIAIPVSWWISNLWLNNFAYRASIGVALYLYALLAVFLLTLIAVSYQAIKASLANPVESLRAE